MERSYPLLTGLCILALFLPLIWELVTDADGETPKEKKLDVFIRIAGALLAAGAGFLGMGKPIIDGFILSLAIHFFAFDYAIAWLLHKRGIIEGKVNWFEYLGSSYTDDVLRQFTPWQRLLIKSVILIVAIVIYIIQR